MEQHDFALPTEVVISHIFENVAKHKRLMFRAVSRRLRDSVPIASLSIDEGTSADPIVKQILPQVVSLTIAGNPTAALAMLVDLLSRPCNLSELKIQETIRGDEYERDLIAALSKATNLVSLQLQKADSFSDLPLHLTKFASFPSVYHSAAATLPERLAHPSCLISDLNLGENTLLAPLAASIVESARYLTRLNLSGYCGLGAGAMGHGDDIAPLAEVLKANKTITSLDLSYQQIGAGSAGWIAQMLKVNRTLKNLNLEGNSSIQEGEKDIWESVGNSTTLTEINVEQCEFTDQDSLLDALRANQHLVGVGVLHGNLYHHKPVLDALFAPSRKTTRVSFGEHDHLGPEILHVLFRRSHYVESLQYSAESGTSDEEVQELASFVELGSNLTQLFVHGVELTDDRLNMFVEGLEGNKSIRRLRFRDCKTSREVYEAIGDSAEAHPTLETIVIDGLDTESRTEGADAMEEDLALLQHLRSEFPSVEWVLQY